MSSDRSRRWRTSLFSAGITALAFLPLFLVEVTDGTKGDSDFPTHAAWALDIQRGAPVPSYVLAHSAWQFLLLAFNVLLRLSVHQAELVAILMCVAVTAGTLCWHAWPIFERAGLALWQALLVVLAVNLAAPVAALWFLDHELYLGYVGIISYHNPTIILLRPLALLQFLYAVRCLAGTPLPSFHIPAAALVSLLATFTKPNFAICLIPAMVLITAYRLLRKQPVHLAFLVFGFLIPTGLLLVWQFWMTYAGHDSARLLFSAFGVMASYSHYLLPKFLLSILFPVLAAALFWRQAVRSLPLIFAWLIFLFGSFFTYFMAEGGSRFKDGNFTWSGEITLFVLFAVSTFFLLQVQKPRRLQAWLAGSAWLLHIAAGLLYYGYFTLHLLYVV